MSEKDPKVTVFVCPTLDEHDFSGWRDDPDGRGGSVICVRCGLRAMDADLLRLP